MKAELSVEFLVDEIAHTRDPLPRSLVKKTLRAFKALRQAGDSAQSTSAWAHLCGAVGVPAYTGAPRACACLTNSPSCAAFLRRVWGVCGPLVDVRRAARLQTEEGIPEGLAGTCERAHARRLRQLSCGARLDHFRAARQSARPGTHQYAALTEAIEVLEAEAARLSAEGLSMAHLLEELC